MKPLHVHLTHPPKPDLLAQLQGLLAPQIRLTQGTTPPADLQFLIDGNPTLEILQANPQLCGVIIPWAGAPRPTIDLVKQFPALKLYNLHHNADATAEFAVTLLLAAAKLIVPADRIFRAHNWTPRHDPMPAILLHKKTVLILGYGTIGQRVAQICRALGMHIIGVKRQLGGTTYPDEVYELGALTDLLPRAQIVIICLPLTEATQGLLGERELALLPPQAIVVNVGRAAIVEEAALYNALQNQHLHAAALDVWYEYPKDESEYHYSPPAHYAFHELDNVVMSPHRAGGVETPEVETARMSALASLLNAAAEGIPLPNEVNLELGY